ncbi:semaphorin-4A-like isoform X1 [Hypanus sabinus]|uniref:semaphorin-4A-like isoform X1 n=2 Tax=Hypanus sabinus TaxID=79690 RepID=UPI0028C42A70|nr:semaphorin-4A-like isoform X1 [Hypanus sabinus]XP_059836232.1 semaphorin-4A-like isoform X1 [Hypanus sabinus]XP_059836233.1 semaphorin-4A-like isoform X1 [Hypanus sabinus]XP_059836234.1 semaphorin-4A-like isoform X1 [Hypanus sabinus]XP_059836235.1 semaphorin-4A-like isoform X1 [Hypanus sabinus]XP_059836236.1 semaphorin-4A-like isoform X1 [Hypanus sabinus]XP_059836237.1 semaphorin-4A-like isoform X1 [Hypanus sabinus]XP_059836238.1 semaphorin-4A-like isoform X1 [Hypanus sabinus]XP_05983623
MKREAVYRKLLHSDCGWIESGDSSGRTLCLSAVHLASCRIPAQQAVKTMDSWLRQAILALVVLESVVQTQPARGPLARISHPPGDPSRQVQRFSKADCYNYSSLLLSQDEEELYVGARDNLFSIDTETFGSMETVKELNWTATEKKMQECSFKGKSKESDCFNFILVVLPVNESCLYICGTYAFSPTCTYVDIQTFSLLTDATGSPLTEDGKGRIPFNPSLRYTVSMVDGELYSGTTNNFQGTQHHISRSLGHQVPLKTEPSCNWLQEPSFVGSTFIPEAEGDKIYFFFTESRTCSDLLQRMNVTMVARVCKSDVGGERVLQKRWTTFLKAQLLCYLPEDQFPLNILQDVFVSKSKEGTVIYGVFSSQWFYGGSKSSAICAFDLADIQAVFNGKYKILNREQQIWSTYRGEVLEPRPGACNTASSSDSTLNLLKDVFLMDGVVHPLGRQPQLTRVQEQYVKITVDSVRSIRAVMHRVMFLVTDHGFLHKAVIVNNVSYIIEEIQLSPAPGVVRSLVLSPAKGVLYIGSSTGVLRVAVSNCSAYPSCGECVLSRDPYCAWDNSSLVCRETRNKTHRQDWLQDIENADAATLCSSQPVKADSRTQIPIGLATGADSMVEKVVCADSWVHLPCKVGSRLAQLNWTQNGRDVLISGLKPQPSGISFAASSNHQGLWECWAMENGFRTLVASYLLRLAGVSRTGNEINASWSASEGQASQTHTYLGELVAVSVLLATVVLLVSGLALNRYCSHRRAKKRVGHGAELRSEDLGVSEGELESALLNKTAEGGPTYPTQTGVVSRETKSQPAASSEPRNRTPSSNPQTQVDI